MARVYVSSTYDDLKECRERVRSALRKLRHEDVAMEYYVAENKRPLAKCLEDVASCDLYLGIFAWRYGYVPPGTTRSITELEYRRAVQAGKDCLILLLKEDASWPVDRIEFSAQEKIQALREELGQKHITGFFTSKHDIEARVMEAVIQWQAGMSSIQSFPAPFQVPPLPAHYTERDTIVRDTIAQLLDEQAEPAGVLVVSAFHGLGGIGKTTLATAVAHHPLVRDRFKNRILWATLGQTPDLLSHLTSWIHALGDRQYRPTTTIAATSYLRSLLHESTSLLVLDDVWEPEHAKLFLAGGPNCRLLLTTRRAGVADDLGARLVSMEEMTPGEALDLLRKRVESGRKAPLSPDELRKAAALAKETGYLPLALELIGALVARGYPWDDARHALSRRASTESYPHPAQAKLEATLGLSLDYLRAQDAKAWERMLWLAVLPAGLTLNLHAVAVLWELPERDASHLLNSLADDSILQRRGTRLGVHDRMHEMAHRLLISDAPEGLGLSYPRAHGHLLERYAKQVAGRRWDKLPDDGYIHSHLVWHLEQAEQIDAIHELLGFQTPEGQHAWFAARDQVGQAAGFVADVRTAWRLAKSGSRPSLGKQCRYALIVASLHSLAQVFSPELLHLLVRHGVWSVPKALDYVRRTPEPNRRATALMRLLPVLLEQKTAEAPESGRGTLIDAVLNEVEATIASGLDSLQAASLFAEVARYDTGEQQARLVQRAIELTGPSPEALRRLARSVPHDFGDHVRERACEACSRIENPYKRVMLLTDLITEFSSAKAKRKWTAILQEWTDALVGNRTSATAVVRGKRPAEPNTDRENRLLMIKHLINAGISLPLAWLHQLAQTLPKQERDQITDVLEQGVPKKPHRKSRDQKPKQRFAKLIANAHSADVEELISLLPEMDDRDEAVQTLVRAYKWRRREEQGEILTRVAQQASADALKRLIGELVQSGRDSIGGQCVLAALAPEPERSKRFDSMISNLAAVTDARDRESAMISIVRACPLAVVQRALSTLQQIDDMPEQAGVVFVLAPYLSGGLSPETMRYLQGKGKGQIVTLTQMVAELSRAMRGGVLTEFVREAARSSSEWWIVEALTLTILRLHDRDQLHAILQAGKYISASDLRARLVGRLALRLAHVGHLENAIDAAMSVPVVSDRWTLLADLAAELAKRGMTGGAETVAARIQNTEERSKAHAAVALHLAARGEPDRAKELAQTISTPHWHEWIQARLEQSGKPGRITSMQHSVPREPPSDDASAVDFAAIREVAEGILKSGLDGPEIRAVIAAVGAGKLEGARSAARNFWTASFTGGKTYLEMIAEQPRPRFLRKLQELGPLLALSLDAAEVDDLVCAIHEAGSWWP